MLTQIFFLNELAIASNDLNIHSSSARHYSNSKNPDSKKSMICGVCRNQQILKNSLIPEQIISDLKQKPHFLAYACVSRPQKTESNNSDEISDVEELVSGGLSNDEICSSPVEHLYYFSKPDQEIYSSEMVSCVYRGYDRQEKKWQDHESWIEDLRLAELISARDAVLANEKIIPAKCFSHEVKGKRKWEKSKSTVNEVNPDFSIPAFEDKKRTEDSDFPDVAVKKPCTQEVEYVSFELSVLTNSTYRALERKKGYCDRIKKNVDNQLFDISLVAEPKNNVPNVIDILTPLSVPRNKPLKAEICLAIDKSHSMRAIYDQIKSEFSKIESSWSEVPTTVHLVEFGDEQESTIPYRIAFQNGSVSVLKNYFNNNFTTNGFIEQRLRSLKACLEIISVPTEDSICTVKGINNQGELRRVFLLSDEDDVSSDIVLETEIQKLKNEKCIEVKKPVIFPQEVRSLPLVHQAAISGDLDVFMQVADRKSVLIRDGAGMLPIHWAAKKGYIRIFDENIVFGADVNVLTSKNESSLRIAISQNQKNFVLSILNQYSSLLLTDDINGLNEFEFAIDINAPDEILNALYNRYSNSINSHRTRDQKSALHIAAKNGNTNWLKRLSEKTLVDVQDVYGDTPLMLAIRSQKMESIKLLLKLGANPNIKSNSGISPIDQAKILNLKQIVNLLITHDVKGEVK